MANQASAVVIPFPAARLSTPFYGPAVPQPPGDRLSTALDALSVALADQHVAVKRWRDAMADLSNCMRTLSSDVAKCTTPEPLAP